MDLVNFIQSRQEMILDLSIEHLWLVLLAGLIAIFIGLVVGVAITYYPKASNFVLGICQVLMVIPSFAMLGFLLPFFGIGFTTGVIALILYTLLPVTRNTYIGIREIPPSVIEAAKGMGMSEPAILFKIKIPLALPVVMAGFRTAMVMVVGIAAIAAYIGAGGLGELIFHGISRSQPNRIITGAIFVSLIAVALDLILGRIEDVLMARTR
ncbi:MAG: ABC transporter permease [Candidatus Syntrophonatronum acetioxidans]|uniref:ABC transporter permease n=1 Tax=Candidatus Syntrophonatronum acetioxidans TaxID=1795816 RepID=A0A424YES0_9FIRM|nr:MAG: ABC transporter permease [Candidatus Syntrophonatronum acetioxidans]